MTPNAVSVTCGVVEPFLAPSPQIEYVGRYVEATSNPDA